MTGKSCVLLEARAQNSDCLQVFFTRFRARQLVLVEFLVAIALQGETVLCCFIAISPSSHSAPKKLELGKKMLTTEEDTNLQTTGSPSPGGGGNDTIITETDTGGGREPEQPKPQDATIAANTLNFGHGGVAVEKTTDSGADASSGPVVLEGTDGAPASAAAQYEAAPFCVRVSIPDNKPPDEKPISPEANDSKKRKLEEGESALATALDTSAIVAAAIVKKKRLCRYPGCTKVIKSQGHCQRHGARARRCKVEGCEKQAQGTHDGKVLEFPCHFD